MRKPPLSTPVLGSLQQELLIADQREAHRFPRPFLSFTIVESSRFHPHSLWSCLLRCQLASSIFNGCCHLGTELNCLCCQKRTFLADTAVTRTRRLAINQTRSDYAAVFFSSCCVGAFREGS